MLATIINAIISAVIVGVLVHFELYQWAAGVTICLVMLAILDKKTLIKDKK